MRYNQWRYMLLGMMCIMSIYSPAKSSDRYIGLDAGYLAGDFDSAVDSQLYSVQLTGGIIGTDYDLSMAVPMLRLEEDNGFSESGIGDILISYGHDLIERRSNGISLDGSLMVKLPTADEAAGLGTGEIDYGAIFNLDKKWPIVSGNLHIGYIRAGDASDINYNDTLLYGATAYKVFNRTGTYLSIEGRTATIDNSDDPLEVHIGGFYALSFRNMLVVNSIVGLNDSGPDFGFTIGVRHWLYEK